MSENESWDIEDDEELKSAVRTLTQYNDSQLPQSDMDELIKSSKRTLALKANVTSFYDDRGITHALAGILAAKCKGAVENSPVRVDNIGAGDVTFRTSDGSSIQFVEYEEMTRLGLAESDVTDAGPKQIEFTRTFLNDNRSR